MKELSGDLPPTFTTETAGLLGIHPLDLYARRDAGEIIGLSKSPSVGATHPLPPTLTPSQRTTAQRQRSCVGCRQRDPRPHRRDAHRHADRSPDQNPHPRHRLPDGDRVPLRPVDVRPWTRVLRGGSRGAGTDLRPGARTVVELMRFRRRLGEPSRMARLIGTCPPPAPVPPSSWNTLPRSASSTRCAPPSTWPAPDEQAHPRQRSRPRLSRPENRARRERCSTQIKFRRRSALPTPRATPGKGSPCGRWPDRCLHSRPIPYYT